MKAHTTAMNTLKQIIVHAPAPNCEKPSTTSPIARPAHALRRTPTGPHSIRPLHPPSTRSGRLPAAGSTLSEEIAIHDQHLARLTTETVTDPPCEGFGVGAHTAAELLIIFGDNPDRIRSEAAFAKLCGACPDPGLVRDDHRPAPPQSRRPPPRQRRPLSRRHRPHAIPPAHPSTTSPDAPPMAEPNARSSGASNASLRERSTNAS